jgi:superfamily II DNA or RNA helicase
MPTPMSEVELSPAVEPCAPPAPGMPEPALAHLRRPSVRLWSETLYVDRGEGLRRDLRELTAPVLALGFEYEGGLCVPASQVGEHVFCGAGSAMARHRRDLAGEQQARLVLESLGAVELELLEDYATAPGCDADYAVLPEAAEQAQCAFVAHAVPHLRALGWHVDVADDYPYQVLHKADWYAVLEPAEKPDWFNLELGIEVSGHRVDLLPLLLEMLEDEDARVDLTRLERQGPRFVRLPDPGRYVEVPGEQFRTLLRVLAELYQGASCAGQGFPAARAAALIELDRVFAGTRGSLRLEGSAAPRVRARGEALAAAADLGASEPPRVEGLHAELRPYQRHGVSWLRRLRECGAGGVLADDMGLGKTLQTIAHLLAEKEAGADRPSLIVAPTSVVGNWRRELARFAPGLRVLVLFGKDRHKRCADLGATDVVVTSYSVLLRDYALLEPRPWHCVVLDEAQAIKNPRSRAARLAKGLDCVQRVCLSGTPIENNLMELWSLCDFAVPGLLGSEEQFRSFFRFPIELQRDEQRLEALRGQVAPYVLRRMKEQVATELPPRTDVVRAVELTGKQRELYESIRIAAHEKVRSALRKRGMAASTVTILAALTRLRQLCCDPRLVHSEQARFVRESAKYELLMGMVKEQLGEGRRILVFSQFATMLGLIARGLREQRIAHTALTGATPDRDRPVRAFEGGDVSVFLISLKAGGTGLNLTSADTVIHYDPWWNPAAQDQATDRAHRIGQTKPVFVYSLIAAGSVEERMLELQQRKRRLANAVIASGQGGLGLGEAEVEHLFSPLED